VIEGEKLLDTIQELEYDIRSSMKRNPKKGNENINKLLLIYNELKTFTMYFVNNDLFDKIRKIAKSKETNEYDLTRVKRLSNSTLQDEMPKTEHVDLTNFISSGNSLIVDNYGQVLTAVGLLRGFLSALSKHYGLGLEITEGEINENGMEQIMESWRKYNKKTLLESRRVKK